MSEECKHISCPLAVIWDADACSANRAGLVFAIVTYVLLLGAGKDPVQFMRSLVPSRDQIGALRTRMDDVQSCMRCEPSTTHQS